MINKQITTRWRSEARDGLVTELVETEVPQLEEGEILAEMLFVPMHGSFWMASHPHAIHPRRDEFLESGSFVFGNGGVGRVVAVGASHSKTRVGDYVSVFGHVPCNHYDCYACTVLHRYTECDYGESSILGHGKGAAAGTYSRLCVLGPQTYEICYRKEEQPTANMLMPFMYAFLFADVRNALTRHPDTLRNRRMLVFGAGQSGHIAAYLHLHTCPEAKILVVDPVSERLESICSLNHEAVEGYLLPSPVTEHMGKRRAGQQMDPELAGVVASLADRMRSHFGGRLCNVLFDASSGNTAQLWDNRSILSPATHCVVFGFGSEYVMLDRQLIQTSGLNLLMSRGVGNLRNRREVIELIKAGASGFVRKFLLSNAVALGSLEEAIEFVHKQHNPPRALHEVPHAYFCPVPV
jgi:threonine dehydrogenase-like Zn-dependent dehydrogenase